MSANTTYYARVPRITWEWIEVSALVAADESVYSYEQGAIAGMNESVLVIKQHFGVEE